MDRDKFERKKKVFDDLSTQQELERAKLSRSDDFSAFFVISEPNFLEKKHEQRRHSPDKLRNYAKLVRDGCSGRQLWRDYHDKKWVRSPGKVLVWEGSRPPFIRRTELAHRSALAEFWMGRVDDAVERISVAIEPIVCTNQNSEADVLLWRAFRNELPAGYEFELRRELLNTLVLGGAYEGCNLEVRFVKTKTKIGLKATLTAQAASDGW